MSQRFFSDHCVPSEIIETLRQHPEIIPQLMKRLTAFLAAQFDPNYFVGKLFVVEPHRIRVRA